MARGRYGFDRLSDQIFSHVESEIDWQQHESVGDSKIEKLFFLSLEWRCLLSRAVNLMQARDEHEEARMILAGVNNVGCPPLLIRAQAVLDGRRADFLLHSPPVTGATWRRLIVECDGHDYHERTKKQAARDRRRDRVAALDGYDSFRFTGSELWSDPFGCADHVLEWSLRGF